MPNVIYLVGHLKSLGFVVYMDGLVVASLRDSVASSSLQKEEVFWAWKTAEEVFPLPLEEAERLLLVVLLLQLLVLVREQERARGRREVVLVLLLKH